MSKIKAYAAHQAHGPLSPYEYEEGPLGADQVDIAVKWCGICHSDLAMINNEWGMTAYPIVPGHEVVGQIVAIGQRVTTLHVGQTVGLGWFSGSCSVCRPCLGGDQNLCVAAEQTIVGRPGGFAQRVRAGVVGHSAAQGHRPLQGGSVFLRRDHGFQSAGAVRGSRYPSRRRRRHRRIGAHGLDVPQALGLRSRGLYQPCQDG